MYEMVCDVNTFPISSSSTFPIALIQKFCENIIRLGDCKRNNKIHNSGNDDDYEKKNAIHKNQLKQTHIHVTVVAFNRK